VTHDKECDNAHLIGEVCSCVDRAIAAARHEGRLEGAQAACESFYINERSLRGRRGWRKLCEDEAARIVAEMEGKP
jgi:hypothetical protein